MCNPAAILFGVLGATQSVTSYVGQRQAAGNAEAENAVRVAESRRAEKENRESAVASTLLAFRDLGNREIEEMISASQIQQDADLEFRAGSSTAAVAAGEAGISGNSVDALLRDFAMQQGRRKTRLGRSLGFTRDQIARNREAALASGKNQVASFRPYQPVNVNRPSLLTPILGIGTSVLGGLDAHKSRQAASGNN
jgi:hypothetical protein